jgi:hypothetical protein
MVGPLLRRAARRFASAASAPPPPAWRTVALPARALLRLEGADVYTFLQARVRAARRASGVPPARHTARARVSARGATRLMTRNAVACVTSLAQRGRGCSPTTCAACSAARTVRAAAHRARAARQQRAHAHTRATVPSS